MLQGSCSKLESFRVNTIQQRNGKAEDKDPDILVLAKILQKSIMPKRRDRIRVAKKIDLRATATRRELVVVTENAPIGILRTVILQDEEVPMGLSLSPLLSGRSFHIFSKKRCKKRVLKRRVCDCFLEQCKSAAWKQDAKSAAI